MTPESARLLIETSVADEDRVVEVDFGIDWRNEPPTQLAIGPVLALAKEHDPGFELGHFVDQLQWVNRIRPGRTSHYGVDAEQLDQIKTRITAWADQLTASEPPPPPPPTALGLPEHRAAPPAAQPYPGQQRDNSGPSIGF